MSQFSNNKYEKNKKNEKKKKMQKREINRIKKKTNNKYG